MFALVSIKCGEFLDKMNDYQFLKWGSDPRSYLIIIIIIINSRAYFNRFCTNNSCIRDLAHNKENATILNLKPEWGGGAPLIQDKYHRRKSVIRHDN
jgi:hypothetical protein